MNLIDALQLGKVIAPADGAQRALKTDAGGRQFGYQVLPAFVQRPVDIAKPLFQLGGAGLPGVDAGGPQRHAAADIAADQRRIQAFTREKRRAHRVAPAGMQVRHARNAAHAGQAGSRV
ncbi:hypothetical protein D3C72_1741780 [compost metagenome]